MIVTESNLRITVNDREIILKNQDDFLLLSFPTWDAYHSFRNSIPFNLSRTRNFFSNDILLTVKGTKVIKLKSGGGLNIKSFPLFLKLAFIELKKKINL